MIFVIISAGFDVMRTLVFAAHRAGFPIVGGNSDIGVQFGGAATLTKFYDGALPYLWNIDLLLSGSVKDDQNGFRLVQQSHVLRIDAPDLWSGRLRIDSRASFQRTINEGYFGLGNATTAVLAPGAAGSRQYQYLQEESRIRTIARFHTGTPVDLALGGIVRFESPDAYPGSKLADDLTRSGPSLSQPFSVHGGEAAFLAGVAAGIMIDTRDSEFRGGYASGSFYQVGVLLYGGLRRAEFAYGNASAVLLALCAAIRPDVRLREPLRRVVPVRKVCRLYDLAQGRYVRTCSNPARQRVGRPRRAGRPVRRAP